MNLRQKTKYVMYGVVGAVVMTPLVIKAVETIPITFEQGDVLSADILNSLFGRLNDVQKGFSSVAELEGTWACKTVESTGSGMCGHGSWGASSPYQLDSSSGSIGFYKATSTVTFAKTGASETAITSTILLGGCNAYGTGIPFAGPYSYQGVMAVSNSLFIAPPSGALNAPTRIKLQKLSPTQMRFEGNSGPGADITECTKLYIPPAPPTKLSYVLSGSSVTLSWVDQSTDETGFRVQSKSSVNGAWGDVTTTQAGATSYTTSISGQTWFRVLSFNNYGDSMTSNELMVQ